MAVLGAMAKRIIHIHLGIKGGAERFFVNLVNGLAERGVEQMALIWPGRVWRDEIAPVCAIREIHFSRSHLARAVINWRIARLIAAFQPQAMMSWMPQATRWIPNDPRLLTAARLGDYPEKLDYFANCDQLVCNTPDIARHCVSLGWPESRATVISNFTATAPCEPLDRAKLDTPADAFVVLGMGRLVGRKGFATLMDAVARVEGAYLWLLGEGEDEGALRGQAEKLGLAPRLRMPGWAANPDPYLMAADVFCIPSSHEPLGNVILEAWALRRPVVATASEGPSWLIRDGENGLLVPTGDVEALAGAIMQLMADRRAGERLAQAGAARLAEEFSRDVIVNRYMQFFFAGVAGKSSGASHT